MLNRKLMKAINESPAILVLTLLGTLLATFSKSFADLSPETRAGVLLFVAFLAYRSGAAYLWARKYRSLPRADPRLSPFAHQPDWQPWPRRKANDLADFIDRDLNKHTLLVAPSGAGKSILTNRLLPQLRPKLSHYIFEEYHDFLKMMGFTLSNIFENQAIFDAFRKLELSLQENKQDKIQEHLKQIGTLLDSDNVKHEAMIILDQAERLALLTRKSREETDSYKIDTQIISSIFSLIRMNCHIRVIFSIRSTNLFESFIYIFGSDDEDSNFQNEVNFFYLWGLNSADDEDFSRNSLKDLKVAQEAPLHFEKALEIANFDDQKNANSFGLRLAVYLFSIIKADDRPRVFTRIHSAQDTSDLIDVMFDVAYEHHAINSERGSERALFDIVIFALAAETRASGSACSLLRLARLAHYPFRDVKGIVVNLCDIGLIKSATIDGAEYYRFAHDSIADYVFQDEGLNVHSRAIDGIRSLTEASVKSEQLVEVENFPSAIERTHHGWRSISYLSVVMFAIFGLVRITFPHELYGLYSAVISTPRERAGYFEFFSMPNYYINPIMYVPHYVVYLLWISYVDRMNRSFIQYVGSRILRFLSNFLAPLGMIVGVYVAFMPQLFVLPIVVIGFLFGIILYRISGQSTLSGEIREITAGWGFRSSVNVVVVSLLALPAVPLYSGALDLSEILPFAGLGGEGAHLGLIILEAFVLYWFWMHIRDEQNRPKAWAANLGLFDKGRMGGNGHHE